MVPLGGMPLFAPGMSVADELIAALLRSGDAFEDGDILVIAQKIVSKSEGRLVRLDQVHASESALEMAEATGREAATLQLILDESTHIMRATPAAVIARHKTGHVLANAGIDASNVEGGAEGVVLLWPVDPDVSARAIRQALVEQTGKRIAVIIADSMGRAWRVGTCGTAIGAAGLTVVDDRRGKDQDMFGRTLQATMIAVADSLAASAVLVMGEGNEATPAVLVRGGGRWVTVEDGAGAHSGVRPMEQDMFR